MRLDHAGIPCSTILAGLLLIATPTLAAIAGDRGPATLDDLALWLRTDLNLEQGSCPPSWSVTTGRAVCAVGKTPAETIRQRLDELLSEFAIDDAWARLPEGGQTRTYVTTELGILRVNLADKSKRERRVRLWSEPLSESQRLAFTCQGTLEYALPEAAGPSHEPIDESLANLRDEIIVDVLCDREANALDKCAVRGPDAVGSSVLVCLRELFDRTVGRLEPPAEDQRDGPPMTANPQLLWKVAAEYPELARVALLEGEVILQAKIDVAGRVKEMEVLRCNRPNMGFEDAAFDAVRQWRYLPAFSGDEPVAVYFTVKLAFGLRADWD